MTDTMRAAGALIVLVLICLVLWAAVIGGFRLVWAFLLFLIGASA
ncbi:hypothetical protein [Micromonospora chalcea]